MSIINCNRCGGKVLFDPKSQKLVCEFCHKSQEIEKDKDNGSILGYTCPSCGAKIVTESDNISTFCIYCKNPTIDRDKITGDFKPDGIIPFKKTKEEAINAFYQMQHDYSLTDSNFLKIANVEEIRGVYVPFWLLDIKVTGKMTAKTKITKMKMSDDLSDNYIEQVKEYTNTRDGDISYTMVPFDGSTHFNDLIMKNIEPFDYNDLKPFTSSYLFGFLAERYNISEDDILKEKDKRLEPSIKEIFRKSLIGGDPAEIEILDFDYTSTNENAKFVLLPVYLLNVKYNDEYYTFAMNGQTSKMVGNFPASKVKERNYFLRKFILSFYVILIFLVVLYSFATYNLIVFTFLVFLDIIVSYFIAKKMLNDKKSMIKSIKEDTKINNYIDDRIIDNQKNKLDKQTNIIHDESRAASVATTLGGVAIVASVFLGGGRK